MDNNTFLKRKRSGTLLTFLEWLDKVKNIKTDWCKLETMYSCKQVDAYFNEYEESDYYQEAI